jgi:hypothetical protein
MTNKQGCQAHKCLFVFRKGSIEYIIAILVFLELKQSQYCPCIMHIFLKSRKLTQLAHKHQNQFKIYI